MQERRYTGKILNQNISKVSPSPWDQEATVFLWSRKVPDVPLFDRAKQGSQLLFERKLELKELLLIPNNELSV